MNPASDSKEKFITGASGTGKTSLLVQNVTQLLQDTEPSQILVLVSSSQMARNIQSILKLPVDIHTVRTLSEAALINENPELKIISNLKSWLILRNYIRSDLAEFKSNYRLVKEKPSFAREVLELIQATEMNSISIDRIPIPINAQEKMEEIKNIYGYYTDFCQRHGLVPSFQVIPKAINLLADYCQHFSHIFIDQYEDFCPGEVQAINELINNHTNVTIFADSVRSNLPEDANSIEKLDKTHARLPDSLAGHINRLIGKNVYSQTESIISGDNSLTIASKNTAVDEAEYIARTIKKLVNGTGRSYSDFAILCRDQEKFGTVLYDTLRKYSIPCSEMPDIQYHPIVQFIILCLQATANPGDDELVLKWLSSSISRLDRVELYKAYRENKQNFLKSLIEDSSGPGKFQKSAGRLMELLSIWDFATGEVRSGNRIHSIIEPILVKGGVIEPGKVPAIVSHFMQIVQDIEEVYEKQPRLSTILNDIMDLVFQQFDSDIPKSEKQDSVRIMSIWESRGLEFLIVFIPGMVRDFFPARHPARQLLYGEELGSVRTALRGVDLPGTVTLDRWRDQEKQLLYIAMTRAKEKLYLTLAKSYQYGDDFEPSPFISELMEGKELSAENCSQYQITYHDHIVSNNINRLPPPDELISKSDVEIAFLRYIRETQHLDPRISQEAMKFMADNGIKENIIPPDPMSESLIPQVSARKFSYSSIRSFLSCPRKYFFDNLLRVESDSSPSSSFGSLIHKVLGNFHNEHPNMQDYNYEELWERMNKILNELWNDKQFFQNSLQSRSYRVIAHEVLRNYLYGEYKRWESGRFCKTTEDNFNFNFLDKYTLTGRIDRTDNYLETGTEIIDFKISSASESESVLKAKFLNMDDDPDYKPQDYQLPIYYYAKLTDLNVTKLVVYQLRTYSKRDEGPFRREIEILDENTRSGKKDKFITKADLESVKDDILETLDKMTLGSYPPEPREDRECDMCDFAFICDREKDDG